MGIKPSPVRMLLVLMGVVFAIEWLVMTVFQRIPHISPWLENFLDASVLVVLLFPTLYFSVFRPLAQLVEQHREMEAELLGHRSHLEEMVAQRTEQINGYLEQHEQEDVLAAYVMGRYLNASHDDPRVGYSILSASHHFSGDAISVARTPEGGLNVMMLDATGHGLSAAINLLPAIQAFYSMSRKGLPLEMLVPEINDKTRELSSPGRFLAATFLHIDPAASRLTGWVGGTPKVYVQGPEGIQSFKSGNLALGILPSRELHFEFFSAPWNSLSMLVTCSDGVLESQGKDGRDLGENWVYGAIQRYGNALDKALFEKIWEESLDGNKPHDDATILIINQAMAPMPGL
ncbi:MAG: serine/threonine-protein phosphatase [Nitrosomonadales bacterium]|nr:serine/threonine-protein phosphatase [Nitrosomonadales bacterium]